jgi:hypothetical protein
MMNSHVTQVRHSHDVESMFVDRSAIETSFPAACRTDVGR